MRLSWRQLCRIALLGLPLATVPGCKPARVGGAAEVKTLDNFAAGTRVRTNSCSASPEKRKGSDFSEPMATATDDRIKVDASITGAQREQLIAEVREALTAVPAELQVAVMSLGGYVDVTPKARERCTRAFRKDGPQRTSDQELEFTTSCYEFRSLAKLSDAELAEMGLSRADLASGPLSGGKASVFRINIVPDAKEIRHSLVRSFGFIVGQLFSRMGEATAEQKELGRKLQVMGVESSKLANLKIRIAQNFLADMAESKVFDLTALEPLLGPGGAKIVLDNYALLKKRGDVPQAIDANFKDVPPSNPLHPDEDLLAGVSFLYRGETAALTSEQRHTRRIRFYDYVFADFFDSIKCHTWGNYPNADVVAKVKAGHSDRDDFLKAAENTLAVAKDFFPHTYALYALADREIQGLALLFSAQSDFKDLLAKKSVGLGLSDDPLAALASLLGGAGGDPSQLLAGLGGGSDLTGLLNKLGPGLASQIKGAAASASKQGGLANASGGGGGGSSSGG